MMTKPTFTAIQMSETQPKTNRWLLVTRFLQHSDHAGSHQMRYARISEQSLGLLEKNSYFILIQTFAER